MMSRSVFNLFLFLLAVGISQKCAYGQTPHTLISITRTSVFDAVPGDTVSYVIKYTEGSTPVNYIGISLSDASGATRRINTGTPVSGGTLSIKVEIGWVNGPYHVDYVRLSGVDFEGVTFNRDGSVVYEPDSPGLAATHSVDLGAQDFQVSGGAPTAVAPTLNSFTRTSPGNLAPGDLLGFKLTYADGNNPTIWITIQVADPSGAIRTISVFNPSSGQIFSTTVGTDWLNGAYRVLGATFTDFGMTRFIYFNRDGSTLVSPAIAGSATTHGIDLASQDFTVSGGISAAVAPALLSVTRTSAANLTAGDSISFRITYADGSSPTGNVRIDFSEPRNASHSIASDSFTSGGILSTTIGSDWWTGPYHIDDVIFTEANHARTTDYLRNGNVANDPPMANSPTTHSVDLAAADFNVFGPPGAPAILAEPTSQTVYIGANATFTFSVSGSPVPTFLWQMIDRNANWVTVPNSAVYSGAATGSLQITDAPVDMAGTYLRCVATNSLGSTASTWVLLNVIPAVLAPTISLQPLNQVIEQGSNAVFSIMASGAPSPALQWQVSMANADWIDLAEGAKYTDVKYNEMVIVGVTGEMNGYRFRCVAKSSAGTANSEAATLQVTNSGLVNIATRAYCRTGNGVTIGGFVINGSGTKRVLIRAVGPSLVAKGIGRSEALLDPTVEVHSGSAVIATNDNWGDNPNAAEISRVMVQVGAGPLEVDDVQSSALLLTLPAGVYSFIVKGKNDTSGIVLLEVYDADVDGKSAKFVNIATRAYATTGNGVAIGGFVISGRNAKQILMRAVGPTLTIHGIASSEVLNDPSIELHRGSETIASNDNWGDNANAQMIVATGARIGATPFAASDNHSAALLMVLPPGVYSFIAKGVNDTSGIVLAEVYDAD